MEIGPLTMAVLSLVVFVFGAILVILWICMPFAVFGLKDKIAETNVLLGKISDQLAARNHVSK
jgi:hypothetical protein